MKVNLYHYFFIFSYIGVEISQFALSLLRFNANYLSLDFHLGDVVTRICGLVFVFVLTLILYLKTRTFNTKLKRKIILRMNRVSIIMYSIFLLEYMYLLFFSKTVERLAVQGLVFCVLVFVGIIIVFNFVIDFRLRSTD